MSHSFSLEPDNDDSNPIAKISNQAKENKGKLIYINENNEKNIANDKLEMFRLFAKHLKLKQLDYEKIYQAIEENDPPEETKLNV